MKYDKPRSIALQCALSLCFIGLVAAAFMIYFAIFWPHAPKFRLASVTLYPFTISPFNESISQINATWKFGFFVRNPNKRTSFYFDNLDVSILYGKELLGSKQVHPFYVRTKEMEWVEAIIVASPVYVKNRTARVMGEDLQNSVVVFKVGMHARVALDEGGGQERHHALYVLCEEVNIQFPPYTGVGTMPGPPKACQVYLGKP